MPKFGALGCDTKGGFAGRTYVLGRSGVIPGSDREEGGGSWGKMGLLQESEGMGRRGNRWVDSPDPTPVTPECLSSPLGSPSKGLASEGQREPVYRSPPPAGLMGLAQGWRRPLVAEGCASWHPEPRPSQLLRALSRFHIERLKHNFQKRV